MQNRTRDLSKDHLEKILTPVKCICIKENCDSCYFYSDELMENITTLIGLSISLSTQKTTEASYRTGEIVRVLTIFSIFLLPLNVITGIYGMNFEHMPELKSPWGYSGALTVMLALLVGIYFWLNKKGWLKNPHDS
ncbi:MAG: CorA family divalent cation transporter [Bdellovibrionales bacterium]